MQLQYRKLDYDIQLNRQSINYAADSIPKNANKNDKLVCQWLRDKNSKLYCQWKLSE